MKVVGLRVCFVSPEMFHWGVHGGFGYITWTLSRKLVERATRHASLPPGGRARDASRMLTVSRCTGSIRARARVVPRPGSPERALRMISESALVVGMRLHSLVLSASCGVPFTSIDYDIKIGGFMDHMGLGGLKCSPEGGLMELAEKTGGILDKRRVISRKISGRTTEVRRLISRDADRLAEAVRRLVDPQSRTGRPLQDIRIR